MINQLLAVGAPVPIGNFIQGGYFAGYYSMTANNVATHGLIVAPKSGGETSGNFGGFYSTSSRIYSFIPKSWSARCCYHCGVGTENLPSI